MAADEDRRKRRIAPRHLGDDIARLAAAGLRDERQPHGHRPAALEDPLELLGVGKRERSCRDRPGAVVEAHHAGVRVAVMIGSDRADHDGDRALAAGHSRPMAARPAEMPVARAVLRARHGVAHEDDLALHHLIRRGLELAERVEADDLAGDSLGRGRGAVAERGDDQLLGEGREDLRRFGAAGPGRHVERFDPDVGESHRLEPGDRPIARAGFRLGPGEALADFGRQSFGDVPGVIVVERGLAQRGDCRAAAGARRPLAESGDGCGKQGGRDEIRFHAWPRRARGAAESRACIDKIRRLVD